MQEAIPTHSNLQDKILIRQSQNGDQHAFEELIRKYQPQISSLVFWHAGPAADAEDIVQMVLCKVYFSLKKFDLNRPFYPWLRRIAVNRCFDERRRLRRRKAYTFAELELEEGSIDTRRLHALPDPYAEDNHRELAEMLRRVLSQLPADYREVIVLHHLKQLPYEEIAPILRCTPQAARVKACRARAALRRLLKESCRDIPGNFSSSNLMRILDACCRRQPRPIPRVDDMRRNLVLCNS